MKEQTQNEDNLEIDHYRQFVEKSVIEIYGDSLSPSQLYEKVEALLKFGLFPWYGPDLISDEVEVLEYNFKLPKKIDKNTIDWGVQQKWGSWEYNNDSYTVRYGFLKRTFIIAFGIKDSKNIYLYSRLHGILYLHGKKETDVNKYLAFFQKEDLENKDFADFALGVISETQKIRKENSKQLSENETNAVVMARTMLKDTKYTRAEFDEKVEEYKKSIESMVIKDIRENIHLYQGYRYRFPDNVVKEADVDWAIYDPKVTFHGKPIPKTIRHGFLRHKRVMAFGLRGSKNIYVFSPHNSALCHKTNVENDPSRFTNLVNETERSNKDLMAFVIAIIQYMKLIKGNKDVI